MSTMAAAAVVLSIATAAAGAADRRPAWLAEAIAVGSTREVLSGHGREERVVKEVPLQFGTAIRW